MERGWRGRLRKGRGRMQRIRKERSPVPAYVMPSGHCQPAPAPFCLARGQGGREGDGRKGRAAPGTSRGKILIAARDRYRSSADHLHAHCSSIRRRKFRRRRPASPSRTIFSAAAAFSFHITARSKSWRAGHRCLRR